MKSLERRNQRGDNLKKPTVYDFPPTIDTEHLRAWGNLDIKQKGKLTIGKNEELFEIIVYPYRFEEGEVKFLSKIDKKTKEVTFIMVTGTVITDEQKGPEEKYRNFVSKFENDHGHIVDIPLKQVQTWKDIVEELKQGSNK